MTTKHLTAGVIVGAMALLIGYDIWVAIEPTGGDTISEVLLGIAIGNPVVPFAFGFLMGHLFWPQRRA